MNGATTALLTEHFSYAPLAISSLGDGLLNTPLEKLGFKQDADAAIPGTDEDGNIQYPEGRLEIENSLHQLETLLEATVDKALDKFEIYVLRNTLTVPHELVGDVQLAHYERYMTGVFQQ